MNTRKPLINSTGLVRLYFILAIGGGLFALLRLLAIPPDKKNSILWGYSYSRLVILAFALVGILIFTSFLINTYRKPQWIRRLIEQYKTNFQTPSITGFYLFIIPLFITTSITVGGILFVSLTKIITDEFIRAYLIRLSPIVIWLMVLAIPLLFLLIYFGYQRKIFFRNFQLAFSLFQVWLRNANLYRILGIWILFSAISFSLLYHFLPAYRPWFVEEDDFLENLTTGLFLASILLSTLILLLNRGGRLTDFAVPAASLISFLEEISYGERYSESIPMMVPEKDIDAFHDYFKIGYRLIKNQENDLMVFIIASTFLVLILLAGYFSVRYLQKQKLKNPLITYGPLLFTLIGAVFVLSALILDLNVLKIPNFTFIEEMLEFFTSLSLFFGAISIYQRIIFENQESQINGNNAHTNLGTE